MATEVNSTAATKYVEQEIANYENDPEFIANGWALDVTECVVSLLKARGENQTWLASQLGVSRARISSILNAPPNMTFLTLAKLSVALGVPGVAALNPHREPRTPGPSELEDTILSKPHVLSAFDSRIYIYDITTGRKAGYNAAS